MSSTPPKKEGVEQAAQSPDDEPESMDREAQETQAQGLGYEFEVKEQDRWLPIANGASISLSPTCPLICAPFCSCCKSTDRYHLASLDARISVNRAEEPDAAESPSLSLRLCVPANRPPCSRHVLCIPPLLHFAATDDAQARPQQQCL